MWNLWQNNEKFCHLKVIKVSITWSFWQIICHFIFSTVKINLCNLEISFHQCFHCEKYDNRLRMEAYMLSPISPNWDKLIDFGLSQKWNLKANNQESLDQDYWGSLLDPCHPLKEHDLAITNQLFISTLFLLPGVCL